MKSWNKLLGQSLCSQPLLAPIAAGYITKIIIISCIVYAGIHEWKEMKAREVEVRGINRQRHDMNDIYVEMLSLSLLCETFMEWNEQDFLTFRKRKQHIDSLLYEFNNSNPNSHMDSIRTLWKDKELYMQKIISLVHKQEEVSQEIAAQIPVIARQSERETNKRVGLLKRLFRKRDKADSPSTASMLYALNQKVVGEHQAYTRELAEQTNYLAGKNRMLNKQLQQMIVHMDKTARTELKKREDRIAKAEKQSFAVVIGLTAFMILLLVGSYLVIHRYMIRINRYKRRLEDTVRQLRQTVVENKKLIEARKKSCWR